MLMQIKLLRVLEEKVVEKVGDHTPIHVNIRLISASNKDLHQLIPQQKFREDLLYRVNSISIKVPSLRERTEDIPVIAFHYLKKISIINNKEVKRISPPAMELIEHYPWPGNVRQLISALEFSAITCKSDTIEPSDLPEYIFNEIKSESQEKGATDKMKSALELYKGNKTLAAKHLGISRVTLWKRLKEAGLD